MKVLHLDSNHPVLAELLEEVGHTNEFDYHSDRSDILRSISSFDGIVIRSRFPIDQQFLDSASHLNFIARVGAGLENIDVNHATTLGITLIAAPEGNRDAVGEHALGMLLSLFNKLNGAHQSIRAGHWDREGHRGVELKGKTVGIFGYGNMGNAFARNLQGFDCNVICFDIKDGVGNDQAEQVSLESFFEQTDVFSLHTPLTPSTRQLVNKDFIERFRKPFWLINTARGACVNTSDVVVALKSGKILGAGLDVLEYEKSSFESLFDTETLPEALEELLQMEQVILSPHVAGWTAESKEKLARVIAEKIIKAFPNS